jgi:hypothetical protein
MVGDDWSDMGIPFLGPDEKDLTSPFFLEAIGLAMLARPKFVLHSPAHVDERIGC